MAKLARFSKWSDTLKKNIEGDVYYHLDQGRHSTTGFFFVPIPEGMTDLMETYEHASTFYNRGNSKNIIKGETADEAKARFVEYHEIYKNAKSVTEKVIMYRFKFSSKNKTSDPIKKGNSSWDGVSNTMEAKIEFDFAICEKTNFNGKISYKAMDERKMASGKFTEGRDGMDKPTKKAGKSYGGWVELPYTVETEAFFAQVYGGMEGIMDKLVKYIGTDELVLDSVERHQKLLIG